MPKSQSAQAVAMRKKTVAHEGLELITNANIPQSDKEELLDLMYRLIREGQLHEKQILQQIERAIELSLARAGEPEAVQRITTTIFAGT